MGTGRTVIIGLDGVPYEMIMTLAGSGVMPGVQRLIEAGAIKRTCSTIPDISSIAWSSIITGCNAGEHGIFGFTDLARGTYQLHFPNFHDLKARPFWDECPGKSVIINVPSTYPVRSMNGVHISGFVSVEMARAVYPPALVGKLQEMDYRLDVDSQKAHGDMRLFLDDVADTLKSNLAAYRYLWDHIDWRNFMLVFTTTDRLLHFLWSAWEDPGHRYHTMFIEHFRAIDNIIGEIIDRMGSEDDLLILSDHGFERLDKDVYVNRLLADGGLLKFEAGTDMMPANIASATKAFAMDPGRIYIHLEGKYPKGSVKVHERQQVLGKITELFGALEVDGHKVIREMPLRDDIYTGPSAGEGPDLVLMANPGFNLKGAMAAPALVGKGIFTGMHSYANAFLISSRKETISDLGEKASVIDAGRLIRKLTGSGRT
jgi:predicted AlkP superfamily phosphohydrolase/phosphomutase